MADGNFTTDEIIPTTHKTLLPTIDKHKKEGGTEPHISVDSPYGAIAQNYENAYYKTITDKVFFLSAYELQNLVVGSRAHIDINGVSRSPIRVTPTKSAVKDPALTSNILYFTPSLSYSYWLRTPQSTTEYRVLPAKSCTVLNHRAYERKVVVLDRHYT